jgi:ribonuclease D
MTNDEGGSNDQMTKPRVDSSNRHSDFVIPSGFVIRHSSFASPFITTSAQLAELLEKIEPIDRVALDTEADSLHSYFEKLCLVQLSFASEDFLIDPLAGFDLKPISAALAGKEIVLQGADFDLRLMRRNLGFIASRIFDTVIAARMLGIREFSLAALVERFFGVVLTKGSQKADWARRPLPALMAEYAINDTHYLLPLAQELESALIAQGRLDWFRQSCQRALEQSAVEKTRDEDEMWRIAGSGKLRGRAAAVLRALWQWRDREARTLDRPPFHILQNQQLIDAAVSFDSGGTPEYRHFSFHRRRQFLEAAEKALRSPESEWPIARRRYGTRPSLETQQRANELRRRRDESARELGIEPSFIAPRAAVDAIAADANRSKQWLVAWQEILLGLR